VNPGAGIPTGTVRFADQTGISDIEPLVTASASTATAQFTTTALGIGSDTMRATYSGDSTFAGSYGVVPETVAGTPVTMTFTNTPGTVGTGSGVTLTATVSNPAGSTAAPPGGTVQFLDGSTGISLVRVQTNGTATATPGISGLGTHQLTAQYSGDATHLANSATAVEYVRLWPAVSCVPSSLGVAIGTQAQFQVTVAGNVGDPIATGSVVLAGGGYNSGSVALVNGIATIDIQTATVGIGNYPLTGTYTPDAAGSLNYVGGTCTATFQILAALPSFAIAGSQVTVTRGATSGNTSTVTVTPTGGFTGIVTLSAVIKSSPTGAQYLPTLSFGSTSPMSITGSAPATATLTISTSAPTYAALGHPVRPGGHWRSYGTIALAGILLLGIPARRRRWQTILGVMLLLMATAGSSLGCGGGGGGYSPPVGNSTPGTTAGSYTIAVTGSSGGVTSSGSITLNVQ
jgi:hypothetical protein